MTSGPEKVIRLGVSSCLLGEEVRFDGGHKHDALLTETFGRFFEWISVCPEMEIGLGTPRESLRLEGVAGSGRLIAPRSGSDHTEAMQRWAGKRLDELAKLDLHGYVLKKDSPSCGMERVRIYGDSGVALRNGTGLFAAALLGRFPLLPVEEEGRLHDMLIRENFIERVFAYARWRAFLEAAPRAGNLVAFHARHKLALLAHDEKTYRKMGRLVAQVGGGKAREILNQYGTLLMQALKVHATARKHANVLFHLMGYLKRQLDAGDKAELARQIENYRTQMVPLIVPITLLLHHFRRHPVDWVMEQTYLSPYPAELMLRNHV
jgi:uncharacterized protein YbgA (DUF1722 family)/uncharacterized protein YbbK (DUF523 family)